MKCPLVLAITLFKTPRPLWRRQESKFCLVMCPPVTLEKFLPRHEIRVIPKSNKGGGGGQHEALDKLSFLGPNFFFSNIMH